MLRRLPSLGEEAINRVEATVGARTNHFHPVHPVGWCVGPTQRSALLKYFAAAVQLNSYTCCRLRYKHTRPATAQMPTQLHHTVIHSHPHQAGQVVGQ